jgi:BASS family bile acid:Na+ symporter
MNHALQKTLLVIEHSYLAIIIIALVAALLVPEYVIGFAPFSTLFLQIIFFLTALKLDIGSFIGEFRNVWTAIVANCFMLIVFPIVAFSAAELFVPSLAVPILLLAAMPAGMTTPLLAEVVGGKPGLALMLTISTSLLAPLTIPLILGSFAGAAVTVSAWTMFWKLVLVIFIPFVLGQLVRRLWFRRVRMTFVTFKPVSLILLGLLIAGAFAEQSAVVRDQLGIELLVLLGVLTAFIVATLVIGYLLAFWRECTAQMTVAVSLAFMNFTLAIYIAQTFFDDPRVLIASVLVIIPWSLLVIPFKHVVHRTVCPVRH